jgi:hypothetical protein
MHDSEQDCLSHWSTSGHSSCSGEELAPDEKEKTITPLTIDPQSKITKPEDEFGTLEPQAKITGGCGENVTPCPNGLDSECPRTPGSNPDGYSCVDNCCIIATKEDPNDWPPMDQGLMERMQKIANIKK